MILNIFRKKTNNVNNNHVTLKKLSTEDLKKVHGASTYMPNEHLYELPNAVQRLNPYSS